MSVGPDHKLEQKGELSCENIPKVTTKAAKNGYISIFGKADLSIEENVVYALDPITIETCEGKI